MTEPAVPRPAASLLLLRESPLEVLMVRRSATGSFASALVFPGGVVEAEDGAEDWLPFLRGAEGLQAEERALRIAALRETFEEVGLPILVDAHGAPLPLRFEHRSGFLDQVRASGGLLPLDTLVPFAHWITPTSAPKRWDTHFYVTASPRFGEVLCDGAEAMEARWLRPGEVAHGEPKLLFPTRLNLDRLAESRTIAEALSAAADRSPFTVLPRLERRGGDRYVSIPPEAGYAVTEERMLDPRDVDRGGRAPPGAPGSRRASRSSP